MKFKMPKHPFSKKPPKALKDAIKMSYLVLVAVTEPFGQRSVESGPTFVTQWAIGPSYLLLGLIKLRGLRYDIQSTNK